MARILCGLFVLVAPWVAARADDAHSDVPGPYGIAQRKPWTTSRVVGAPEPPPSYRAKRVFPRLSLDQPVYLAAEPGSTNLIVVQLLGGLLRFSNRPDVDKGEVFLKPPGQTYSLCFHPRYPQQPFVYVFNNQEVTATRKINKILRYRVTQDEPRHCDKATEQLILEFPSNGHNGGDIAFGPDGYLYVSAGDGTSDSDTNNTGQDLRDFNSAILRVDVDHPEGGKNYGIPRDNPFLDLAGARPEIWSFGLRNPWRMSFDPAGNLWVGDVGQDWWEMILISRRGDNHGWAVREGDQPFHAQRRVGPAPIVAPVKTHPHSESRSITGGYVYRGTALKSLQGVYVYGDYVTGRIWGLRYDGQRITWQQDLAHTPLRIVGFALDHAGELYIVDHGGAIHQLEPAPPPAVHPPFPRRLSETGLFADVSQHEPAEGLIPYSVNAALWSDGARKQRFIALPGDGKIDFKDTGGWNFPEGTVLVKTFSLDLADAQPAGLRRVETRLLTLQEGQWVGYSYVWNAEQTDAMLVDSKGLDVPYVVRDSEADNGSRRQTWHYPSRAECMVCHTRAANFVLGLSTVQMNKAHDYGAVRDNQLRTLEHLGVFSVNLVGHFAIWESWLNQQEARARQWLTPPLPAIDDVELPPEVTALWDCVRPAAVALTPRGVLVWHALARAKATALTQARASLESHPRFASWLLKQPHEYPSLVDPYTEGPDIELRVRSYLHANCSQCHVPAGGGNAAMEVDFGTRPRRMHVIDARPQHDTFGISGARLVVPGDPQRSLLYQRVARLGPGRMPPLATSVVDHGAVNLLRQWIEQLPPGGRHRWRRDDLGRAEGR